MILGNLGTFWSDLGTRTTVCKNRLNLEVPKSHVSTQFVCVNPDGTRIEPNANRILHITSKQSSVSFQLNSVMG